MKRLNQIIAIYLCAFMALQPLATDRNVPGTYSTIQAGVNAAVAGDTVLVGPGIYPERVTVGANDGSSGSFINIVATGPGAKCYGFDVTSWNYGRIIGMEITHTNSSYNNGIVVTSSSHVELLHNWIHDIRANGAGIYSNGGTLSYLVYRGNLIEDMNIVNGVVIGDPTAGISLYPNASDHNVIEYNIIRRVGDFIYAHGQYAIARNNAIYQYTNAYWNWTPGVSFHIDGFQAGSDGILTGSKDQLYEYNWHGENRGDENHSGIWQNTIAADDARIIIRFNVDYLVGAGGIANISTTDWYTFNNTFSDMCPDIAGAGNGGVINARGGAVNGLLRNHILYNNGNRPAIDITLTGGGYVADHILAYLSGTHASIDSTSDPLFVDRVNKDFRLQSGSPARGSGQAITTVTSATGSGTSVNVANGKVFNDGYGIAEGDLIRIGATNSTMVRITTVSGNTLTLASSVSWTLGDPVYFWNHGLDRGAIPYYSSPLTAATQTQNGNDYTVNPNGDTRKVVFMQNGVPVATDYDPPFTATIAGGGVTSYAYARLAQETPFVAATTGGGGGDPAPAPGTGRSSPRRRSLAGKSPAPFEQEQAGERNGGPGRGRGVRHANVVFNNGERTVALDGFRGSAPIDFHAGEMFANREERIGADEALVVDALKAVGQADAIDRNPDAVRAFDAGRNQADHDERVILMQIDVEDRNGVGIDGGATADESAQEERFCFHRCSGMDDAENRSKHKAILEPAM
jgi:hypothetical protein